VYVARPKLFPIPAGIIPAAGPFTVALRFRASTSEGKPGGSEKNGGLRGIPLLGPAPLLAICYKAQIGQITSQVWSHVPLPFLFGSVGLISLFLFVFTRTRREYLWAGISFCGIAMMMGSGIAARLAQLPIQVMFAFDFIAEWIGLSAGPIFMMYLLSVHKLLWRRLNYIFMTALATGIAIAYAVYLGLAPPTVFWHQALEVFPFSLYCVALLVLAIAIDGVRTIGAKAWMPLTPGLFGSCGLVAELAGPRFHAVSNVLYALVPVSLLIVFLLRAARQHRENEQYLLDMRQAQEVQQLLLQERLPQIAGFSTESVYLPAREVGGDFFQVLETSTKSILIVFGDVAGKGLPAAMLVAMLVGAIRTRAKETYDPAEILSALNDRLCGNARGGFATCIAVHISTDGTVDLANSGHLAPYLNGKEISLEGALPLGVAPGVESTTTRFFLKPGDRLTFVSDGVVEAKNSRQELFGFDRLREISSEEAQRIADAAKRFGQEDDITVLTFTRLPIPV
jgi:Stage II sporulation protein E (SpoIIE)